jgi:hypothetical protein
MIWIDGTSKPSGSTIGNITQDAARGVRQLTVSSTAGLTVGSTIRVTARDPSSGSYAGTLVKEFYGDLFGIPEVMGTEMVHFTSRVTAISGNVVTIERPLPINIKTIWTPTIVQFKPAVQEVGIEHLTMKFPDLMYAGHQNEPGFNGINMRRIAHSWVDEVHFINADSGVFLADAVGITVRRTKFTSFAGRADSTGATGHHALEVDYGTDSLFTEFDIQTRFVHDLTVDHFAMLNVFSNGKGTNLCMDHHGNIPYANLFTNIDLGTGTQPFASGGKGNPGPQTGSFATFWNVRASTAFPLPIDYPSTKDYGPLMNFVGLTTSTSTATSLPYQWHFENMVPADLTPQNLHEGQRKKRLGW